jgi:hypothetical protein
LRRDAERPLEKRCISPVDKCEVSKCKRQFFSLT